MQGGSFSHPPRLPTHGPSSRRPICGWRTCGRSPPICLSNPRKCQKALKLGGVLLLHLYCLFPAVHSHCGPARGAECVGWGLWLRHCSLRHGGCFPSWLPLWTHPAEGISRRRRHGTGMVMPCRQFRPACDRVAANGRGKNDKIWVSRVVSVCVRILARCCRVVYIVA